MRKSRFTEAQIIGMIKEQEAGLTAALARDPRPLVHPRGHVQADFSDAVALIRGVRQKIHFFCMDVPQSDEALVQASDTAVGELVRPMLRRTDHALRP